MKAKHYLICSFLIFSSFLIDQEGVGNYPNHQIEINVSPDFSYRLLTNSSSNGYSDGLMSNRNSNEVAIFGYTGRVSYSVNFSRNFVLSLEVHANSWTN